MQTAESSLPEHHGVDLAVVMLRQIKARHGHEAVCEVACDMLITAAAILRQESLEPIYKSPEEDNEASELYEAEEVLGVVFPTDEDAALPLNPSKEALHEPASHIAA